MEERDRDLPVGREDGPAGEHLRAGIDDLNDGQGDDAASEPGDELAPQVDRAPGPAEAVLGDVEERGYLDQLQRLQAEFSNYRKRITRERADWDARAKGEALALLIPVLDDLDRAREAHAAMPPSPEAEGLLMILGRLEDILRQAGLERQSTEPGTLFDPEAHEALMTEPSATHEEGRITGTLQPGYVYRGILLRPARVRVSQGPPLVEA